MTSRDILQLVLYIGILLLLTKPLALFMEKVFEGQKNFLTPLFGKIEKIIYKIIGVDPEEDQSWSSYAFALIVFEIITCAFTFVILKFQHLLPLNPQSMPGMNTHMAVNTAVSFLTNTDWQDYGGEGTLGYFSQMVALTFQNFMSAAVGIIVAVALIRGIFRKQANGIGNFWADLVRCNLYILLPISFIFALFLISQGVIQNFLSYTEATTLEGVKQIIAQGPVASQVAIKMLGTNGGGFFNANAAHPFENPTPLSNFIQMLSIFLIPSALVYLLGRMIKNIKHGWSVWVVMLVLFVGGVLFATHYEYAGTTILHQSGVSPAYNMEGKETRFGIFNSSLFAGITTDASCGAVNGMHDSFTPLGGLVPLFNILLGEIVFGGVGSGLYGMLIFIILTVFIAGLMVGRTPEYIGKKIQSREVQLTMIALIAMALSALGLAAWAVLSKDGLAGLNNNGPHGFSEILYAYASTIGNNGSAFAGLTVNTPFYDYTLALNMLMGRFCVMIPMLAVAGSLAKKNVHPEGDGTFQVYGGLFITLLLGIIILVGVLTYLPALTLGPIVEHLEMLKGTLF